MSTYPINSESEQSRISAIPATKFHSKSLIISVIKPIFEQINEMEERTLRNLNIIVHAKQNKEQKNLEIGIEELIAALSWQETILPNVEARVPKNTTILGLLIKKYNRLIEQIETAKKTNPEKLQQAIHVLNSSQECKPETATIINALISAIPSKESEQEKQPL